MLGILYESYVHPLTILSTLPSAGVGAVLALRWTTNEFNLFALIGVILLIGIVKKNAIMMIDFALVAEREEGLSSRDAIYKACLLRFRPIMMTTFAAILGALPLAIGFGTGSELRQPLGIAIVGGARGQPAAHALHDARRLSLPRPLPRLVQARLGPVVCGADGRCGCRGAGGVKQKTSPWPPLRRPPS